MPEDKPEKKPVKVLLKEGGGPPPGYECHVIALSLALNDAASRLTAGQIEYLATQVADLATHRNPTVSETLDLDKVETFYELRCKGGGVGPRVNVRIYYDLRTADGVTVIRLLGVDVKKNEGQINRAVKARILRRQRMWDRKEFPTAAFGSLG